MRPAKTGAISFALFIVVFHYQACAPPSHDLGSSDSGSLSLGAESVLAFEQTLKPLLQNCSGCHGVSQQPLFAVDDSSLSHDTLLSLSLVSLESPENSRIVQKIREGHQSISTTVADDMETQIGAWNQILAN